MSTLTSRTAITDPSQVADDDLLYLAKSPFGVGDDRKLSVAMAKSVFGSAPPKLKITQRDVTAFTLTQDDVDAFIHVNPNLAACTITLEEGVFVKGDEIHIIREEKPTGVTVAWTDDLKVNGSMASVVLPAAYSAITIVCKDDEGKYFTVIGDYE